MNTPSVEQLNQAFAFHNDSNSLCFKTGKGDIPVIEIQNELASATISLQGAHLLSWVPAGEEEVIWLSDDATFAAAKSVRGGVPICWPWFGAHENNAAYPAHGFARTVLWQVTDAQPLSTGGTQITFKLDTNQLNEDIKCMWPQPTVAEYTLTVAKTLSLQLTTLNHSDQSITIGQALHTYFNVGDLTRTTLYGLEGRDYLDKTEGFKRKTQVDPVSINTEIDRIYLHTADDVIIDNTKRKIFIKKQGSQSTVVWNPWKDVAEKMGDLGKSGYLNMLCVESANAAEDTVTIRAGERHTLFVTYAVEGI